MNRVRAYLSFSGSFSRIELLIAAVILLVLLLSLAKLKANFPAFIPESWFGWMVFSLYPIWGIALGKRSRDLGTTFTYGMILGTLVPIIGIVFLFQAGKKFRDAQSQLRTEAERSQVGIREQV